MNDEIKREQSVTDWLLMPVCLTCKLPENHHIDPLGHSFVPPPAAPVAPTSVRYCGHEVPVGKACPECFPAVAPAPVATATIGSEVSVRGTVLAVEETMLLVQFRLKTQRPAIWFPIEETKHSPGKIAFGPSDTLDESGEIAKGPVTLERTTEQKSDRELLNWMEKHSPVATAETAQGIYERVSKLWSQAKLDTPMELELHEISKLAHALAHPPPQPAGTLQDGELSRDTPHGYKRNWDTLICVWCKQYAFSAAEVKHAADCYGVANKLHGVAAPPPTGTPEPLRELVNWLRNYAEERVKEAMARESMSGSARHATPKELRAAKILAEQMAGRKLPLVTTDIESANREADIQDRIAVKLIAEAKQVSVWADMLAAVPQASPPDFVMSYPDPLGRTMAPPDPYAAFVALAEGMKTGRSCTKTSGHAPGEVCEFAPASPQWAAELEALISSAKGSHDTYDGAGRESNLELPAVRLRSGRRSCSADSVAGRQNTCQT